MSEPETAMPTPCPRHADRLVGVAVRSHAVDQALQPCPIIAEWHQRYRASTPLFRREQCGRVRRDRRCDQRVIVLVAIPNTAVPRIMIVWGAGDAAAAA